MALPMLVGGADCGPSNPLQGLSKRFDQDRGLQQDHFGVGRPGSSRETFRTQHPSANGLDQDAARFFSSNFSPSPNFTPEAAYDVSALRAALSPPEMQKPIQFLQPQQQMNPTAWASDFVQQQPLHLMLANASGTNSQRNIGVLNGQDQHSTMQLDSPAVLPQAGRQWGPTFSGHMLSPMSGFSPAIQMPNMQQHQIPPPTQISWEKEFTNQELGLAATSSVRQDLEQNLKTSSQPAFDPDELARTAGLLLENVKDEQNPKFQNSQFMGLMKQLRDGDVIVEGNQMVQNDGQSNSQLISDLKGKGRAVDIPHSGVGGPFVQNSGLPPAMESEFATTTRHKLASMQRPVNEVRDEENANDAYFRQDNEDYTRYWGTVGENRASQGQISNPNVLSWDQLQNDWEHFEATTTGVKPINNYQFQDNNPYMVGDSSRSRPTYGNGHQSVFESVLELEAVIQRDMENASAWFDLGVKQQENEREQKAIQALQRAVELDPSHLPTWLALAVSYTNDSNRVGTYDTIYEWVTRNEKYRSSVLEFRGRTLVDPEASITERYAHLIQCLIAMARSDTSGEVDADIQIALAVLLNTNEDYEKAQDCFRTALAVRPDDWLLYNRVGATMANSGHAGDALQYYYRALELNPGYIRARFNLGISCINLRRYEEAAQHILDALQLQDNDGIRDSAGLNDKRGVTSTALWDSLKTTCLHMQRVDLATLCDRQDVEGFRNRFHS